jgi:hypothetical protein
MLLNMSKSQNVQVDPSYLLKKVRLHEDEIFGGKEVVQSCGANFTW